MKKIIWLLSVVFLTLFISGCSTLNKNRMLRTPKNYPYAQITDSLNNIRYRIAINDIILLRIYSNDGYRFFSLSGDQKNNNNNQNTGVTYKVRQDSTVKIPVIGKVKVVGLTLNELENKFEKIMKDHVNNPFVIAEIRNKRIYLFSSGSNSSIVTLENENTTLFEVLAKNGGLSPGDNASRIKVIRGGLDNPEIFLLNVSNIESAKKSNMVLQSQDIIYIDPFINYAGLITSDVGSIMGLISSILLVYSVSQNFN